MQRLFSSVFLLATVVHAAAAQPLANMEAGSRATSSSINYTASDESTSTVADQMITLHLSHVSVERAIREIARKANVGFTYSGEILPPASAVISIDADKIKIATALERVLEGTGLRAKLARNGRIVIARGSRPNAAKGTIRGRITNAKSGNALASASVSVKGTEITVRANDMGQYEIRSLDPGTYTLIARGIGFVQASVRITLGDSQTVTHDFALMETTTSLSTVVVTSTVAGGTMRSLSNSVKTITSQELKEKNITRIEDIFRGDVPGIFVPLEGYKNTDPYSGAHTPQVRGQNFLSASGGDNTSTLKVYIDGVQVSDYSQVAQIDPGNIDRIEIVSGPAATTIYGTGASDGVMQIFMKKGEVNTKTRIEAGLTTRTYDSPYLDNKVVSPRLDASITGGGAGFSYSGFGAFERQGAWVPNYKNSTHSFSGGVQWENGPVVVNLTGNLIGPNLYNSPPDPWYALGLHQGRYSRSKIQTLSLTPTHTINSIRSENIGGTALYHPFSSWLHTLTLGSDGYTTESKRTQPAYTSISDTLLNSTLVINHTTTVKYQNVWQAGFGAFQSMLSSGLEYTGTEGSYASLANLANIESPSYNSTAYRTTSRNTGYYGEWQLSFKETAYLTLGGRAEQNPDYGRDVGFKYAPRVGLSLVHDFSRMTVKVRGGYGSAPKAPFPGYKEGIALSKYTSGNNTIGSVTLANPNLLPADNQGAEYGIDLYVGQFLTFTATGYNQIAHNDPYSYTVSVDTTVLGPNALEIITATQYQNLGAVQTKGADLTGKVNVGPFSVASTYSTVSNIVRSIPATYFAPTYTNITIGDRMPNIPSFTASTTLSYRVKNITANLQATSSGRYRGLDVLSGLEAGLVVPSLLGPVPPGRDRIFPKWTKYNLNINREVSSHMTAYTRVDNLTNSLKVEGYDNRFPLNGRVFTFGLRVRN